MNAMRASSYTAMRTLAREKPAVLPLELNEWRQLLHQTIQVVMVNSTLFSVSSGQPTHAL